MKFELKNGSPSSSSPTLQCVEGENDQFISAPQQGAAPGPQFHHLPKNSPQKFPKNFLNSSLHNKRKILCDRARRAILAKVCELAIKLSANQLVNFGGNGRRIFV